MKGCDRSMFKSSRCMRIVVIGIGKYNLFFLLVIFCILFGGGEFGAYVCTKYVC